MSGIILLVVLAAWIFVAVKITGFFVRKIQFWVTKVLVAMVLFVLIFIAPVADDIAGGFQFRALCTPENILVYDEEKVRNKRVITNESTVKTINKIIPIRELTREWLDPVDGKVLITHKMYQAKGGWLSRSIGFPQGSPPYTFDGGCDSKEYYELFEKLNITKVED
jgi:hypothetical protein